MRFFTNIFGGSTTIATFAAFANHSKGSFIEDLPFISTTTDTIPEHY